MKRLAFDTNAAVDYLRTDRVTPPPVFDAEYLLMPLPTAGELLGGAFASDRVAVNLAKVDEFINTCILVVPDLATARLYGRLRGPAAVSTERRRNDLWIAAICIQHHLPLLTNDRAFDAIDDLTVIHW